MEFGYSKVFLYICSTMFERIYQILATFLGESKQGGYMKECENYQFNCPCCTEHNDGIPDNKYNLEVLLSPAKGLKFHCWKCGDTDRMKGRLSYLIKRYGGRDLYLAYKDEMAAIRAVNFYSIENFDEIFGEDEATTVKLPPTFTKIDLVNCQERRVVAYLQKRKITQDIIDRYNLGYTTWDEKEYSLRNRLIIPSFNAYNDLNYWVGRDFITPKKNAENKPLSRKTKYKNCTNDKKRIIFQESLIDWDSSIILVEGAIDCLYFTGNAISLLGKKLTKDMALYDALMKKANAPIYIALDADTEIEETKKIYALLDCGRLKGKIYYIRMEKYKDFGEAYEQGGKKNIVDLIKSAKQFDELDLLI